MVATQAREIPYTIYEDWKNDKLSRHRNWFGTKRSHNIRTTPVNRRPSETHRITCSTRKSHRNDFIETSQEGTAQAAVVEGRMLH